MTSREIAEQLVDVLTERIEVLGGEYGLLYPAVEATRDYVSVTVAGSTVWDDEDENDNPEDGETFDTALHHAEGVIQALTVSLAALLPPAE